MSVEIRFVEADAQGRTFLTWRPMEAKVRWTGGDPGAPTLAVELSSTSVANAGQVDFSPTLGGQRTGTQTLQLASDGTEASVWISGVFGAPSSRFGDVSVEARLAGAQEVLGSKSTMVRIRKNANNLTGAERDRFLSALATLNGSGAGPFAQLRDMHKSQQSLLAAHGAPGFLPWHRAYMLDFERELQAIDAEVTLPYWRFDQAAPNVFNLAFLGRANAAGRVQFAAGHPLLNWFTDGTAGIERGNVVGPNTVLPLLSERNTLGLGGAPNPTFAAFDVMEDDPHGDAHWRHGSGFITHPITAPKDPLFFLLHCNVDRLWAKWQFAYRLDDPDNPRAFDGASTMPGHRLNDTMWPWDTAGAPGGRLPSSAMTPAPGPSPRIRDMIDYFGRTTGGHLGFAYDDVPY
ncbi:MAG: tyrosinase family protein [Pseudomonadota bacterium]|nr:tyrosinase family protein [Pseudomonadota bacterium]